MTTTFCRMDQPKVEPLDVLSALVQWDSPKPGIVVVKVLPTHPITHQGLLAPLTLAAPSMGHFDCSIPTCSAALMQTAPLFFHSDHPSARERGRWAKNLPISH